MQKKTNDKFKPLFNLEMPLSLHFRTTITVCVPIFGAHNFLAYIIRTCSNKFVVGTSNLLLFICYTFLFQSESEYYVAGF